MEFTGERPTLEQGLTSSRMRYKAILPFCRGKKVLDYGCGLGLGSYMLSQYTLSVHGYDPVEDAIKEAGLIFKNQNLTFSTSYKDALNSADILVMVEVIEHFEKEALLDFLKDLKGYLPLDLVCTTPNGDLFPYHPERKEDRRGYHTWHYTESELYDLFHQFYKFVDISGHARDPILKNFTGYTVYATNKILWHPNWLTEPIPGDLKCPNYSWY